MSQLVTNKKNTITQLVLPSLLINTLSLAVPLTVLQIYDRILPNQSYGTATLLIAGATIAVLLEALLRFIRTWLLSAAASNTEKANFSYLVSLLDKATPKQLLDLKFDGVQDGLESVSKTKDLHSGGLISGIIDVPFALIFLCLVAYVGGELVLVPIAVWLVTFLLVWGSSFRTKQLNEATAKQESLRSSFLMVMTKTLQGIKRQAVESRIYSQFKRINYERSLSKASEEQQSAFAQECIQLASLATSVVLVIVGSLWVLDGQLTTGGLAACSILSGRAVAPLSALVGLRVKLNAMHSANQAIEMVKAVNDNNDDVVKKLNVDSKIGAIELVDVIIDRFGHQYKASGDYLAGDIVLVQSDIRHIASHILAAVSGNDDMVNGQITSKNVPFPVRENIAYVGSRGQLLFGSILDNLCGFEPSRAQLVNDYVRELGLHSVITRLPEGLETKVGITPSNVLSDGSVKLINIIAQLAANKQILVFDKPEVDLDLASMESLVNKIKIESEKNKIVFIVSHHPQFINLSNKKLTVDLVMETSV